jgi:hypothetical protein
MTNLGDAFTWPFADREWFPKMILQGLIAIIPIVGHIALLGWLLVTVDNYRAGRRELAPAGFHLERGIALWAVLLVYVIVLFLPGGIVNGIGVNSDNGAGLAAIGGLLYLAALLLLLFLIPAIFLNTYRAGFSGGFDVAGIWQLATTNPTPTALAAVMIFVANLISPLGFILCCVGLLFTVPYSAAIMAGIVTWYERELAGPAPAPTPAA